MQPLDLLAAVLPSSGFYCVAELTSRKKEHRYSTTIESAMEDARYFSERGYDTYYALAAFTEKGSRLASNAERIRSLFIDIDCGDKRNAHYKTKRDAVMALSSFTQANGLSALGDPWLVDSGGGIHAYWPLQEEVSIVEWLPVAEALKRAARTTGFNIDMTVTADAARVLRVPGTINKKYVGGRLVTLKSKGATFELAALREALSLYVEEAPAAPVLAIPGHKPKAPAGYSALKLLEASETKFKDIVVRTVAGTGCGQLAYYLENAADDGMEPLWRGMLSLAKVCSDAEAASKKLSSLHPYPPERTQQKLAEIKGPYPCVKFDSENPGICNTCPHWGKITNPLALGRSIKESTEPVTVEIDTAPEAPTARYGRPVAPKGFFYSDGGGVCRNVAKADNSESFAVPVLPYDMFVVAMLHKEKEHSVHMLAMHPQGMKNIILPTRAAVAKDDLLKNLAEQNIYPAFGNGTDKHLYDYVRGCIEQASLVNKTYRIPTQYGWQDDGAFVYQGVVYETDGRVTPTPMIGLENIGAATRSKGTLDDWRSVMEMMVRRRLFGVVAHACIGFGAPLMQFTGMRGMTFHAGHKQSGTGKSVALSLCASVWGNPVDYRTGKSTSPVAMQQRAGNLNSLPFVCDELTMKARSDLEWFPSFVFDFSEGRGKERMESSQNRERVNTTTWCSLALFTSNVSMQDYMTGARTHSSEGELRRFLEWSPKEQVQWDPEDEATLLKLQSNYGVAGPVFAKWLVANKALAQQTVEKIKKQLALTYKTTSDERFWLAGVAAVVAGAVLAGRAGAGIIDLPIQAVIDEFGRLIENARNALRDSQRSAEDILNEFTREFYGQFVIIKRVNGGVLAELGGSVVDQSITRTKVAGRIEQEIIPGRIDYFIEEQMLRRHCATYGFGYKEFCLELEKRFTVTYLNKDMLQGTKGPNMRVRAMRISRPAHEVEEASVGR